MRLMFTDPYKRDSEAVARRIARMLFDSDKDNVFKVQIGSSWKWQVGQNNDYWLHEHGDGTLMFSWRYGGDDTETAYRVLLDRHLGVRIIEEPTRP